MRRIFIKFSDLERVFRLLLAMTAILASLSWASRGLAQPAASGVEPPANDATPPLPPGGPSASESPTGTRDPATPAQPSPVESSQSKSSPAVKKPELVRRVDAIYPEAARAEGRSGTVVLTVTVLTDGSVGDVRVAQSISPLLDQAAIQAVKQWHFNPALVDGTPVAVRITVPFQFAAELPPSAPGVESEAKPALPPVPEPKTPPEPPSTASADATDASREPVEVLVEGSSGKRAQGRSASDFALERDVLEAAPHHEGVDVLKTAPGMYVARPEGAAVAHRYMLRGFDSEHGQDIEFHVAGLPINLPSHIHGQGYADLGFLMAETVDELRVTEGVHDPRQGDFAVAGSIDIKLGVRQRGILSKSSYGSFDTFRQLLLWAPPDLAKDSFGAVAFQRSNGFGQNRRGQSISAIVQHGFSSGDWRTRAIGVFYGARSGLAGILRKDDVDSGRVGFYDVYPYPTAQAQNALAGRAMAGVFSEYVGVDTDSAELGLWIGLDNFRLQENFTGFLQRSQTLANVAGRGDLIEQRNRTQSMGLLARYRTAPYQPAKWLEGFVEVGLSGRVDEIQQSQSLLDATVRLQTWDRRVDASILGMDIGAFGDLDFHLMERLKLRLGARANALSYDISDKLANLAPAVRASDAFIPGFRRSAMGIVAGPRASSDYHVTDWLTLHASYGQGYRSPQARTLDDGEQTPFTKVRSSDLGTRFEFGGHTEVTLAGYHTLLSDDVAFDAREGRLERVGKTRRLGAVLHALVKPWDGVVGAASVTYVDAELLQPPPPTATEPEPAFEKGQNLPYVPPIVVRADIGANRPLLTSGEHQLVGRVGLGFSMLSARPLPYGAFSDPFSLFDLSCGLGFGRFRLGAQVYNVMNTQYSAIEYSLVSDWDPTAPGSRLPARHISAGSPRTLMGTLEVQL